MSSSTLEAQDVVTNEEEQRTQQSNVHSQPNKHKNEPNSTDETTPKKRAIEGDDSRPSPSPTARSVVQDSASLAYQQHHSRLLVKIYDALVNIQNGLANVQEGQAAATEAMKEAGRVYLMSQYLTTKDEYLGPRFPWLMDKKLPEIEAEGKDRMDADEVVDLYEELAELARKARKGKVAKTWRCPSEGSEEVFGRRQELREHLETCADGEEDAQQ